MDTFCSVVRRWGVISLLGRICRKLGEFIRVRIIGIRLRGRMMIRIRRSKLRTNLEVTRSIKISRAPITKAWTWATRMLTITKTTKTINSYKNSNNAQS